MDEPANPDLEAGIDADLDDEAAHLVYGDWLQLQGAPRGKLIAVQAELARARRGEDGSRVRELVREEVAILEAHRELFLPPDCPDPALAIEWGFGFWSKLRGWMGADPARVLGARSARFLRSVTWQFRGDAPTSLTLMNACAKLGRSLERLALTARDVPDAWNLEALVGSVRLRELHLSAGEKSAWSGTGGRHRAFHARRDREALATLDTLERLDFDELAISEEDVSALGALVRLKDLSFFVASPSSWGTRNGPDLTGAGMQALATLPLESLAIGGYLHDSALESLAKHPSLRVLRLESLSLQAADAIATMPSLEELSIVDNDLSSSIDRTAIARLAPLARSSLRSLTLDAGFGNVDDATCELLATFVKLRRLRFWDTAITAAGLRKLEPLRDLEQLVFFQTCELTNDDVSFLAGFSHLKVLDLSGQDELTDGCIDALVRMRELTQLNVSKTGISPEGVKALRARMPWLDVLSVDGTGVDNHW